MEDICNSVHHIKINSWEVYVSKKQMKGVTSRKAQKNCLAEIFLSSFLALSVFSSLVPVAMLSKV